MFGTYGGLPKAHCASIQRNYALSYTGNNVTVGQRSLTVTADCMTYGNAVPTLTYVVGGSGLVNGDSLSGALATIPRPPMSGPMGSHKAHWPRLPTTRFPTRKQCDSWPTVSDGYSQRPIHDLWQRGSNPDLCRWWFGSGGTATVCRVHWPTTASSTSNVGTYGITKARWRHHRTTL